MSRRVSRASEASEAFTQPLLQHNSLNYYLNNVMQHSILMRDDRSILTDGDRNHRIARDVVDSRSAKCSSV